MRRSLNTQVCRWHTLIESWKFWKFWKIFSLKISLLFSCQNNNVHKYFHPNPNILMQFRLNYWALLGGFKLYKIVPFSRNVSESNWNRIWWAGIGPKWGWRNFQTETSQNMGWGQSERSKWVNVDGPKFWTPKWMILDDRNQLKVDGRNRLNVDGTKYH